MRSNDIEEAYDILKTYNGENNQILYYKYQYNNHKIILKEFDVNYILNNCDFEIQTVNKVVKITNDLGKKLQEKYEIDFTPEKILITKIIGEMGNSYHCYVQYRKSIPPVLMYINKRDILNEINTVDYKEIDIDFDYYDGITAKIGRKLKRHQKDGIKFLIANKKCILADTMGLGKTNQLVVAALASKSKKILVICPASLKTNWKNEICFYDNEENVNIINGSEWGDIKKWTIVNYDILPNFYELPVEPVYEYRELPNSDGTVERLKVPVMTKSKSNGKMVPKTKKTIKKSIIKKCLENSKLYIEQFDCVIVDEAHKLSNNTSNRYKILEDYLKRSNPNYIFLTTGTPLTNKPINLFYILKLLSADITNDYRYFIKRYCGAKTFKLKDGREITTTGGATNLNELREKIKHLYIRRLLSDMSDMVEKNIVTKYYDLSDEQLNTYHKLWNEYLDSQQEQGKEDTEDYRQLVEGIIVRQFLAKEMVENTIELADSIIEEDEKVVIICTFQEEMDAFMRYYKDKAVLFNGKMTLKQKDKSVSEFMNNPKVKVFIGQSESMVGITLTSANKLIFNSYSWIAASNAQAEDRVFRLNQDKDVTCIYQVFNDEISQHMYNVVQNKKIMAEQVIKKEIEK